MSKKPYIDTREVYFATSNYNGTVMYSSVIVTEYYNREGSLLDEDDPAIEYPDIKDGRNSYYLDGISYMFNEWVKEVMKITDKENLKKSLDDIGLGDLV